MVLPRNRGQCQWGLDKARMCLPLSQPWWRPFQFSLMLPAPCVRLCAKNLTSLLVYSAQWPFRQIPLQKKQSWFAQGFGHRSSLLSRRSLSWETCAALPLPCAHSRRSAVHWGPKSPRGAYYLIGALVPPLTEKSSTPETVRWKANHCQIRNQRGSRHNSALPCSARPGPYSHQFSRNSSPFPEENMSLICGTPEEFSWKGHAGGVGAWRALVLMLERWACPRQQRMHSLAEITLPGKVKVAVPNSFKRWVPNQVLGKPLSGKIHCLLIDTDLRGAGASCPYRAWWKVESETIAISDRQPAGASVVVWPWVSFSPFSFADAVWLKGSRLHT